MVYVRSMRGHPVTNTSSTDCAATAGCMSRNWRSPWTLPRSPSGATRHPGRAGNAAPHPGRRGQPDDAREELPFAMREVEVAEAQGTHAAPAVGLIAKARRCSSAIYGLVPSRTRTVRQPIQPHFGKPYTPGMNRHPRHTQITGNLLIHHARFATPQHNPCPHSHPRRLRDHRPNWSRSSSLNTNSPPERPGLAIHAR